MSAETPKSMAQQHPLRMDIPILIIASSVLLYIGLTLPVMTVSKLWEKTTFSIPSGIQNLWHEKYYFLATVIFFFSVVFPAIKLAALFMLWFLRMKEQYKKWALHWLGLLGKWSMLDVFVTAILIVAVKLGPLAKAKAESGIYYFGASIILAMAASSMMNFLAFAKPNKNNRAGL